MSKWGFGTRVLELGVYNIPDEVVLIEASQNHNNFIGSFGLETKSIN